LALFAHQYQDVDSHYCTWSNHRNVQWWGKVWVKTV